MTRHDPFTDLNDDQLLAEVKRLASGERRATADLIRALMELDARRLYLGEGCSSLFSYCMRVLHLSEGGAYNRIETARAARRFPAILPLLEEGALTMTAVRLLAPHLTTGNCTEVLTAARHKSKAEIERLVAWLSPKPAVPAVVRKLPTSGQAPPNHSPVAPEPTITSSTSMPRARAVIPASASSTPVHRPIVVPLAPERYKLQLTISKETHDTLRRLQALLRHAIPTGDPAEIVGRALMLLLEGVERRRYAATPAPRPPRNSVAGSRHVPASVRRDVWRRDGGQCAFLGQQGRCTERAFLEFHHVRPYAAGGAAVVANIELRCRSHNLYEASLFFGDTAAENDDAAAK
jgi:hypothetical protein